MVCSFSQGLIRQQYRIVARNHHEQAKMVNHTPERSFSTGLAKDSYQVIPA
jgi:hypothetical protein